MAKDQPKTITTTGAARLCGVSHMTIIKWFESGLIQGYRLPGSGDRRILMTSLIEFMQKNNIPVPDEFHREKYRILVVDDDERIHRIFKASFSSEKFEINCASDGYTAGLLTQKIRPHLIILDISLPDIDGRKIASSIRENIEGWEGIIFAISGINISSVDEREMNKYGIDYFEKKPLDMKKFVEKVEKLLEEKFG